MLIRISHAKHGAMHVYDMNDLARHKAMGWSEDGAEAKPEPLPVVAKAEAAEPVESLKKKPGRPPKAA